MAQPREGVSRSPNAREEIKDEKLNGRVGHGRTGGGGLAVRLRLTNPLGSVPRRAQGELSLEGAGSLGASRGLFGGLEPSRFSWLGGVEVLLLA